MLGSCLAAFELLEIDVIRSFINDKNTLDILYSFAKGELRTIAIRLLSKQESTSLCEF